MKQNHGRNLLGYLNPLIKRRLFVTKLFLICTGVSVIISLLLVNKYTATASILPPSQEQESMIGLISAGMPMMASGLGRMAGLLPGASSASDLFAAIMQSRRIKDEIIRKYGLLKEFRCKTFHDAYKNLDRITNIEVSGEGIIVVTVTYKNKYLAADIANSYIEEIDKFNTATAMTMGKRYRIFIEQRLGETIDSLAKAEEALRDFQERNRTIALDVEIESAIKTIADLKSKIILLEVKKGALVSSAQYDNPYLNDINKELRELNRQLRKIEIGTGGGAKSDFGVGFSVPLSGLPGVSLEYARLLRDAEIQSAIYELLTEQYEQAKIMEVKDTPTVQFLDKALPSEKKSYPRRSSIVVAVALLSLIVATSLAYILEYMQGMKDDARWGRVASILRDDISNIRKVGRVLLRRK